MAQAPFLALITPIGGAGGPVDPGYSPPWAQVPPGTRPPTGPVDPGYSPPWAQVPPGGQGGGPVDPGYSPPWAQVRPPVDPGYSPPWAQVPPGTRPPTGPVDPGYSPPWAQVPGQPPQPPLGIWGPGDPRPTLPIAGWDPGTGTWPLPPDLPPAIDERPIDWKIGWTPQTGWIVVGIPQFPHVTPSA